MEFIERDKGELYIPQGHDSTVSSRKIFNGELDCHVTTFGPGSGMAEEVHESQHHIFYVLDGTLEVLKGGSLQGCLSKNDAVFIPAGEYHEIRNQGDKDGVFLAITFDKK
jgi:mannose-6-phosphate isomerase-like protein (cupin superfamily)